MPHPSYRSALAHALDDLIYWAKASRSEHDRMGTEYQMLGDINRYRHRLGLPDFRTLDDAIAAPTTVEVLAQDEASAETLMQSVLGAIHEFQVRTNWPFAGTIYLAPHDWDRVVSSTSYYPSGATWPHERKFHDPHDPALPRTGKLFGRPAESCPDIPEGQFLLGGLHRVGVGTSTADSAERAAAGR